MPLTPDEAAELAECFTCHSGDLFGYACLVTRGDQALADDLVQEAFQAAAVDWSSLRELRRSDPDKISRWLRVTLRHKAVDVFRHNQVARHRQADIECRYRVAEPDTCRDALTAISLERCWQIISKMPERQHLIAVLHWREGMTPTEIATALGIAPSTVSVQLHIARRKLVGEMSGGDLCARGDTEEGIGHAEKGGTTS